jgi:outer membrane protein assembly factor BamD
MRLPFCRRSTLALLLVAASMLLSACTERVRLPDAGEMEPDKFLYQHGTAAVQRHHWIEAREYFRKLVDTYTQSPYRQEARLAVGDTYLGEGGYANFILAANEFREFLRYYPLNPRADYAQYRLAVAEFRQMLGPERDQTSTLTALTEISTFIKNYPTSEYMPEVIVMQRLARNRLSESDFSVGFHYFRTRWYYGTIPRLQGILESDPTYERRDAVYFYLGESYFLTRRPAEAAPYYDKLVGEFAVSEYLDRAKARLEEIKRLPDSPLPSAPAQAPAAAAPAPPPQTQTSTSTVTPAR